MIYKWQFLSRFSILRDKWRQPATSTLLDKNLTCEFKRKNSFTLSKSCMKTEQFLCEKRSLPTVEYWRTCRNLTTKQRKNSLACRLDAAFFSSVFRVVEKLWAVFTPRRNHTTQHKLLEPKYRETKLKSTRKRIFWALKDIYLLLLVAAWPLHWTLNRLDLPPEAFTAFCWKTTFPTKTAVLVLSQSTMLELFLFKSKM